ncbi:T9SS type A sorting domain-containing protein [Flavitalea antarctica]
MKKFYSIIAFLILSTVFSSTAFSQPVCRAFANISEDLSINRCKVDILVLESYWFGAQVRIYAGNTEVTAGAPVFVSATGTASVPYVCGNLNTITAIEFEKDGNKCGENGEIEINQRIVLPIVLGAFNATLRGNEVALNWTSQQEAMSSHFEVEKSGDGKSFTTVGTVKAAGFSINPLNYSFTDKSFSGAGFYRLKMVDLDYKFKYSKVVYVNGGSSASTTLSVFPNPFRSDVQLKGINASDVNKNNIRVFNVAGKEVSYQVTGANSIAIDANLPKGVYILQVKDLRYKLVKE